MKDLGAGRLNLGLEIAQSRPLRNLWLTRTKYDFSGFKRFGMENCHPILCTLHWMTTKPCKSSVLNLNTKVDHEVRYPPKRHLAI